MKILLSTIVLTLLSIFGVNLKLFSNFSDITIGKSNSAEGTMIVPAAEGKITGTVFFSKSGTGAARSSKGLYGKSTSRLTSGGANEKRAVVYISKMAGKYNAPSARPAMRQKNVAIVPRVLPVVAGTTVDFPNEDDIYHNIFSLSPTGQFDLGRYAKGVSKSVKFSTLGQVKVFCDIHSQMGGIILVLQNPFYAVTNADGSYTISGLPAGTYDVVAWQENSGTQTMKVTVAGGESALQNFSF